MFGQSEESRELDLFNASQVEAHKPAAERYSDEWLDEAEAGKHGIGDRNSAAYLRTLLTIDQRKRAVSEAYTLANMSGGRYSGNVWRAVHELARNILAGNEAKELQGEEFARVAREREAELRKATGNPNAIYYPPMPNPEH